MRSQPRPVGNSIISFETFRFINLIILASQFSCGNFMVIVRSSMFRLFRNCYEGDHQFQCCIFLIVTNNALNRFQIISILEKYRSFFLFFVRFFFLHFSWFFDHTSIVNKSNVITVLLSISIEPKWLSLNCLQVWAAHRLSKNLLLEYLWLLAAIVAFD